MPEVVGEVVTFVDLEHFRRTTSSGAVDTAAADNDDDDDDDGDSSLPAPFGQKRFVLFSLSPAIIKKNELNFALSFAL